MPREIWGIKFKLWESIPNVKKVRVRGFIILKCLFNISMQLGECLLNIYIVTLN
jgi:hypothetical protein